jgi:predicted RNA-binding protein YlxR (DUF448 family)
MAIGTHLAHRTCIACRKKQAKSKLVRFITKDNVVFVDLEQQHPGRGAYTCADNDCFQSALKRNAFARAFKKNVVMDKERLCLEFDACLKKK